ncbi:MAG TPA: hypothetical protein VNC84_00060 [Gammaproteobacteria bacterium]|jgi:hypothetical protein|nr:hypothetical protein [Gammaproteobacteria bacterium]
MATVINIRPKWAMPFEVEPVEKPSEAPYTYYKNRKRSSESRATRLSRDGVEWFVAKLRKRAEFFVTLFAVCAEVCNIGLGVRVATNLVPFLMTLPGVGPVLDLIVVILDTCIYVFRAFVRLALLAARHIGIVVDDEKYGAHPHQTKTDLFALFLFVAAVSIKVLSVLGIILTGPVSTPIVWALGTTACAIIWITDYCFTASQAGKAADKAQTDLTRALEEAKHFIKNKKDALPQYNPPSANTRGAFEHQCQNGFLIKDTHNDVTRTFEAAMKKVKATEQTYNTIKKEATAKKNSQRLYFVILIGVVLLVVLGTLAPIIPAALVPLSAFFGKAGAILLALVNIARITNYFRKTLESLVTYIMKKRGNTTEKPDPIRQALEKELCDIYTNSNRNSHVIKKQEPVIQTKDIPKKDTPKKAQSTPKLRNFSIFHRRRVPPLEAQRIATLRKRR